MKSLENYQPIADYAKSKNYSVSAIRKKIKKGNLRSMKFRGKVFVLIS